MFFSNHNASSTQMYFNVFKIQNRIKQIIREKRENKLEEDKLAGGPRVI